MMLAKRIVSGFLFAGYLTAACQSAPNSPPPSPTRPQATISEEQVITEIPTQAMTSTVEPTQEPTLAEPTETDIMDATSEAIEEVLIPVEGLDLVGTFFAPQDYPQPWPGVILIHMLYGDQSQWESFPNQLTEAGFAVLSIDLRGHGETGGEVDWDLAIADLQEVWSYLAGRKDVDQDRTAFVGASIGANLALVASSNESSVRTAVLLSPGLSYAGVETESAIISYGDRPVFIVASQEDTYAANSSTALDAGATGDSQLLMFQDAGHGTFMLRAELELAQMILEWLAVYLE